MAQRSGEWVSKPPGTPKRLAALCDRLITPHKKCAVSGGHCITFDESYLDGGVLCVGRASAWSSVRRPEPVGIHRMRRLTETCSTAVSPYMAQANSASTAGCVLPDARLTDRDHTTARSNTNGSPVTCSTRRFDASSDLTTKPTSELAQRRCRGPSTVVPFSRSRRIGRYGSYWVF
jgi:hypothetical protein